MNPNKQKKGLQAHKDGYKAEELAVLYLRLKGYRILERNFKPPRGIGAGEIDVIAMKNGTVVFIEIKYRPNADIAAEAISEQVQQRRIKGAEYFLMQHPDLAENEMRFDVILMTPKHLPEHIQNAFMAD